jgi:hypothetical protein
LPKLKANLDYERLYADAVIALMAGNTALAVKTAESALV